VNVAEGSVFAPAARSAGLADQLLAG